MKMFMIWEGHETGHNEIGASQCSGLHQALPQYLFVSPRHCEHSTMNSFLSHHKYSFICTVNTCGMCIAGRYISEGEDSHVRIQYLFRSSYTYIYFFLITEYESIYPHKILMRLQPLVGGIFSSGVRSISSSASLIGISLRERI